MARTVNEEEYAQRRNDILDAAQQLLYTRGYEQMVIQDILDALGISKGAFYHYFDSKQALLEALVERMIQTVLTIILPIIRDPQLAAIEKFHCYIDTAMRWKNANKEVLLAIYRGWYADDNAIVRQKVTAATIRLVIPLFAEIIDQGIGEGVFHCNHPQQAGEVMMSLLQGMGESMAALILSPPPGVDIPRRLESTIEAYSDGMERVLGAPPGSLQLVDPEALRGWVTSDEG